MAKSKNRPEKKISPVNSGLSVAIWLNSVETDEGTRQFRTLTIAPKRYRDRNSGEWKDSSAYSPSDLPLLIYALEQARDFVFSEPLPGHKEEPSAEAPAKEPEDEVPY